MSELNPHLILGVDETYNKSDAIDAYNSLTLWYKNNKLLTYEEREYAINILDFSINKIKSNFIDQVESNKQFNKDFLIKNSSNKKEIKFGYIEKII